MRASRWNLAIAATALRDWKTAREVWKLCGMTLQGEEGPITDNFGTTPIRLDPDGEAEVVWAQRLCPVRARILSLPFPESGVAYGDIVLHDGAPVGSRLDSNGNEKSVFNMLEMFEPGEHSTYVVNAEADSKQVVAELETLCEERHMAFEDWHASVNPCAGPAAKAGRTRNMTMKFARRYGIPRASSASARAGQKRSRPCSRPGRVK